MPTKPGRVTVTLMPNGRWRWTLFDNKNMIVASGAEDTYSAAEDAGVFAKPARRKSKRKIARERRENPKPIYEEEGIKVYKVGEEYRWFTEVKAGPAKDVIGMTGAEDDFDEAVAAARAEAARPNPHVHYDRSLGAKLHQWHDGMSDPIYQVGSLIHAGKPVPMTLAQGAHDELEQLLDTTDVEEHLADLQHLMDMLQQVIVQELS